MPKFFFHVVLLKEKSIFGFLQKEILMSLKFEKKNPLILR